MNLNKVRGMVEMLKDALGCSQGQEVPAVVAVLHRALTPMLAQIVEAYEEQGISSETAVAQPKAEELKAEVMEFVQAEVKRVMDDVNKKLTTLERRCLVERGEKERALRQVEAMKAEQERAMAQLAEHDRLAQQLQDELKVMRPPLVQEEEEEEEPASSPSPTAQHEPGANGTNLKCLPVSMVMDWFKDMPENEAKCRKVIKRLAKARFQQPLAKGVPCVSTEDVISAYHTDHSSVTRFERELEKFAVVH